MLWGGRKYFLNLAFWLSLQTLVSHHGRLLCSLSHGHFFLSWVDHWLTVVVSLFETLQLSGLKNQISSGWINIYNQKRLNNHRYSKWFDWHMTYPRWKMKLTNRLLTDRLNLTNYWWTSNWPFLLTTDRSKPFQTRSAIICKWVLNSKAKG